MRKKIGRTEIISLPELKIEKVSAKVDTGAYGVALHVDSIDLSDNKLLVRINDNIFEYDKFRMISVKNSFGRVQKRFSVLTKIEIGDKIYKFYVSLTNRKNMRYSVLLGRRFLYKFDYLVDVKKKNINDTTKKV